MNALSKRAYALITFTALGAGILGCGDVDSSSPDPERPEPTHNVSPLPSSNPTQTQHSVSPGDPNHVPGELIVKFKSETATAVTADVATCLREGKSFSRITADGSDSLDGLMGRHGVSEAHSLIRDREGLSTASAKARLRGRQILPTRLRTLGVNPAAIGPQRDLSALEDLVNVYRLRLPEGANLNAAMADLRKDPHVEYVIPNYVAHLDYTPNDPYFSTSGSYGQPRADQWDTKKIRANLAWDSARGQGVVVAVVDTGLDLTHPDIAGNIWTNSGEIAGNGLDDDGNGYIDDVHGWSTALRTNELTDEPGHGTHVAGTIAAQDNNGVGTVGVAPDSKIMAVQAFSSREIADLFTLSQGLVYATQNGADVINNSWSMCQDSCPSNPLVEDAVRAAHAAGAVVVFAAGNAAADLRNFAPQNMPEVIVVSATTPSDTLASFSNYGLLDVGAPGSGDPNDPNVEEGKYGILSLRSSNCFETHAACLPNLVVSPGYSRLGGTSMAAPQVSGAAALILSHHPEYSQEQVRQVIRRTSVDVGSAGYDSNFGHGRLDVGAMAAQQTPLEALITMPLVINSSAVPMSGSAAGSQFARYTIEYGVGTNPTSWTNLMTSTVPVQRGGLYFWRADSLPDGDYTLRLRAYKTNGAIFEDRHIFNLDRIYLTSPTSLALVPGGDLSITGAVSPGNFRSYAFRVQKLETGATVSANVVVPNGGLIPVSAGELAVWKTQGLAAGHYRLSLDVTLTNNAVITESVVVLVDPLLHAGFPVDVTYQNKFVNVPAGPLTVADLQNDGRAEVITGWGEKVMVLRGDGSVLTGWPQTVATPSETWNAITAMPVAGDIDGDGQKEVIAPTGSGKIFAWGQNGVLKAGWPRSIPSYGQLSVTLADVNRNGVLDVVVTDSQSGIHVFTGNGSNLAGWPVSLSGITGPATVADLNLDNRNEVIVSVESSPSQLYVYSATGALQSGWPKALSTGPYQSNGGFPVVGDMDDDGDLEIVAVASDYSSTASSRIYIYQHTGQLLRSWSPAMLAVGPPVLADVDGDGSLEIVTSSIQSSYVGALHVWRRTGTAMSGWPKVTPTGQMPTELAFHVPIVANIDGDVRSEIIVARDTEFRSEELGLTYGYPIQVYRHDGATITSLVRPAQGSFWSRDAAPALADIDGDAKLELLWTETRSGGTDTNVRWPRVHAWDLTAASSSAQPWAGYRADARHSGVAQSVVPLVRLTQRNTTRRVNGTARFVIRAGGSGIMQVKHPNGAAVQYAVGSNLLRSTTLGWGEQFTVPPNQDVQLRVVTTTPIDVTVDWW
jgi:subtilisin family serine protease